MERRDHILDLLRQSPHGLTGGELARRTGVSRQVIVQDIALLRAEGNQILATPQGYLLQGAHRSSSLRTVIAVRHAPHETEDELLLLVNLGITVVDVIVDHPLYGELRGNLMMRTAEDVQRFMARLRAQKTSLLSSLTHGLHLHTLDYDKASDLRAAQTALAQQGLLLTE